MNKSAPRCVACQARDLHRQYTYWQCNACDQRYPCIAGIPQLYLEADLGASDKSLRAGLYDNLMGRFYNFIWPFISLPVRPVVISKLAWAAHVAIWVWFAWLLWSVLTWGGGAWDIAALILLIASVVLLARQPYIWKAILLTPITKIAVLLHPYRPKVSFAAAHERVLSAMRDKTGLHQLDVATGSCNSLYRHGWMELDATYTGVDLSQDMMLQGARFMATKAVPMDFYFTDAHVLPFADASFDIVTCYGAVNGFSDPKAALAEMARVLKPGGYLLLLDEQLYEGAGYFEGLFFRAVLAAHDVFTGSPDHLMPEDLCDIQVHQVYQFYYVCTARKSDTNTETNKG